MSDEIKELHTRSATRMECFNAGVEAAKTVYIPKIKLLTDERDALKAKLNHNRCHSGHETLPLAMWECPACVNILRARIEELENTVNRLQANCID